MFAAHQTAAHDPDARIAEPGNESHSVELAERALRVGRCAALASLISIFPTFACCVPPAAFFRCSNSSIKNSTNFYIGDSGAACDQFEIQIIQIALNRDIQNAAVRRNRDRKTVAGIVNEENRSESLASFARMVHRRYGIGRTIGANAWCRPDCGADARCIPKLSRP